MANRTIGDQVRAEIRRQGLSCYRIARETGLNGATIGRFVNAKKPVRSDSLDYIVSLLGLELVRSDELVALRRAAKSNKG
jgi:plasmid maintenance system antidote protein VapI